MSTIFQLFERRGALFVAIALEMCCAYLIIQYNSDQRAVADASWSFWSGIWMDYSDGAQDYFRLNSENEQLLAENAELLSRMPNVFYTENVALDSVKSDSLRQQYSYISAEIINKTPLSANINYVINRGEYHGVEPHQGVIGANGVIGIVTDVAYRHARVMSLCNVDFRLSAKLKDKAFFGSLSWSGGDTRYADLSSIPEYAEVIIGDTIETTGYSNTFPTGIQLGTVAEIGPKAGTNTLTLRVRLFNDFFRVKHAYVVRNLIKDDLEKLDQ